MEIKGKNIHVEAPSRSSSVGLLTTRGTSWESGGCIKVRGTISTFTKRHSSAAKRAPVDGRRRILLEISLAQWDSCKPGYSRKIQPGFQSYSSQKRCDLSLELYSSEMPACV